LLRFPLAGALLALALAAVPSLATADAQHEHTPSQTPHADHASPGARPDDHAPIGVMGDHMHPEGGGMLSYRYMRMDMDGNRDDTHRVGTGSVLSDFLVAPTEMDMEMHMLGLMWAPSDRVTLMGMLPILRQDMDHVTRMGQRFTTRTKGIGDVSLGGMIRLLEDGGHHVHLNAGLSLPTGSITEKDDTPAGHVRLPYPMQLGSGTFDLLPGITYTGMSEHWSWGGQLRGTLRLGRGDEGYRWGHRFGATAWVQRPWLDWLSTSLRLDYQRWGDIHGDDDRLNPAVVPTADPNLRAGERIDALLGLNFLVVREGPLAGTRFAIEGGIPIHQDLDGPQLETDWLLTAGFQYAFH
jgi:hypothetical protein